MKHTTTDITHPTQKPVRWLGSARKDLARCSPEIRDMLGFELFNIQEGRVPSDFKAINTVGSGVYEIRVHARVEHRAFYVARFAEAVYVLHVFEKKSQKTMKRDLEIGKRRFLEMMEQRLQEGRK